MLFRKDLNDLNVLNRASSANYHRRPHAVRNKRIGKFPRNQVRRFPTRTVLRHNHARIKLFERLNRRLHDWLEDWPGEMEAADDRMNAIYSRHLPRAFERIHHAGGTAT